MTYWRREREVWGEDAAHVARGVWLAHAGGAGGTGCHDSRGSLGMLCSAGLLACDLEGLRSRAGDRFICW